MSLTTAFILLAVAGLAGTGFGYFLRWIITMGQRGSMELQIKSKFLEAQEEATKIINEGKKKGAEEAERLVKEHKEKEQELKQTSERMVRREELLDKRQADVDKEQEELKTKIEGVKQLRDRVDLMVKEQEEKLSKVAGLGVEEAREEIMKKAEKQYAADLEARMHKLEMSNNDKIDRKAKDIITTAVHRIGNSVPHDVLSTTVTLPNDDIKGKIIGKEGRNIKAFERATGVEVIVDDTPGTITLSSFDPVRRQIARVALENLILDGRIQPARIEEVVEKAKEEITVIMKKKGEEAAYEARVSNVDPRLIMILGRLYFRTSYGQNVLNHSVEMSHLAGIMAEELGANVAVARAGALFHDIGKAVDHEVVTGYG
jgi:ribonuclease Y